MKTNKVIYCLTLICALIPAACNRDLSPLPEYEGQWISDIQFSYSISGNEYTISHDNRIYESQNFLVFSDASGDEVKKKISLMAETSLKELKQAFKISRSTNLGIIDRSSKIKIYANRYKNHAQQFFAFGFIIYSIDSPHNYFAEKYSYLIKHELMHVFQHLLGLGLDGYEDWPEVWFSEGMAEFMAGGGPNVITNYNEVNAWLADSDHINPIRIHRFHNYPVPINRVGEYYPMFELAVRYLLSERGQGRTIIDIKMLFEDLKNGVTFTDAFENSMGFSLEYYETHFFDLISRFF